MSVVDVKAGTVAGEIDTFPGGTDGVGVATATGQGYTDDGKGDAASAFDLTTPKLVKQIPAAPDADAIVGDPASRHVFVINGDRGSITVIDPATNAAIATIEVGIALEAGADDGAGELYVNGAEKNEIIAIDTAKNRILAH